MQIVATGTEPLPLGAWAAVRLGIWYLVIQLGLAVVLAIVLAVVQPGAISPDHFLSDDQLLFVMAIAMPASAVFVWYRLARNLPGGAWPAVVAALGWRPVPPRVLLLAGLSGALLALVYTFLLLPLFDSPTWDTSDISRMLTGASAAGRVVFGVLAICIAPPVEEFIFRGVLLAGFGGAWGMWPGVAASTSLFALAHLSQLGNFWPAFVAILVFGTVVSIVRLRSRSLLPGIALHACYNAVIVWSAFAG